MSVEICRILTALSMLKLLGISGGRRCNSLNQSMGYVINAIAIVILFLIIFLPSATYPDITSAVRLIFKSIVLKHLSSHIAEHRMWQDIG